MCGTKQDISPNKEMSVEEIKTDIKKYAKKKDITIDEAVKHLRKSTELREFMYGYGKNVIRALNELEE